MKWILCYFAAATHFLFMGGWHTLGAVAADDGCVNSSALATTVSCNFTDNHYCGWEWNSNGMAGWRAETGSLVARIQANETNTARVRSPLVCSANNKFRLSFNYTFEEQEGCELSVMYVSKPIWQNATKNTTGIVETYVESPQDNFRLIFRTQKNETYRLRYCAVHLIWINFSQTATPTSSVSSEDDDGRLSGEAIAGIIISLFIVIAVVVVIAFLLLRRRTTGGKLPFQKCLQRLRNAVQSSSASTTDTHVSARSNRPVIDGPYPEITSESGHIPKAKDYYSVPSDSLYGNKEGTKPGHGTHYAVSSVPESSNYYSMPRAEDNAPGAPGAPGGSKTNPGYVADDDGGYSTPDDIDRLEMDRQKSNTKLIARSGKIEAAGDSYNKITFQPPHAGSSRKAADTYHHINPLQHPDTGTVHSTGVGMHEGVQDDDEETKVPRSDHAEYSLANDPGDPYDHPPTTPTGKTQNTDLTGKRGAPRANNTDYNHLKLKDGGSPPAGATSGKGKGQGVYNHLEGQVQIDNYNRVDFDGRGGDKQTGDSGGPYNHLGD